MTQWYVYAYDYYGARTYFTVDDKRLPKCAQYRSHSFDQRCQEHYFTKIAAKKLGVPVSKTYLTMWGREPFKQEHLPSSVYREGKWRSYTTAD